MVYIAAWKISTYNAISGSSICFLSISVYCESTCFAVKVRLSIQLCPVSLCYGWSWNKVQELLVSVNMLAALKWMPLMIAKVRTKILKRFCVKYHFWVCVVNLKTPVMLFACIYNFSRCFKLVVIDTACHQSNDTVCHYCCDDWFIHPMNVSVFLFCFLLPCFSWNCHFCIQHFCCPCLQLGYTAEDILYLTMLYLSLCSCKLSKSDIYIFFWRT